MILTTWARTAQSEGESRLQADLGVILAFSKRLLAAAIHKKIAVYEVAGSSNTPVRQSCPEPNGAARLTGALAADHWDQIVVFEGHTGNVTSVSFHAEGKWVVTGSEDGTIRIWDLR